MRKILLMVLVVILLLAITACQTNKNIDEKTLVTIESNDTIEETKLRVGVMDGYDPYIIYENGEVTGPYIDIIITLLNKLDYEYEFVALPWSRLLSAVESGEVDVALPLFDKVERRQLFYYSEEPIGFSQINVVALASSEVEYKGDLTSLSDHIVGVVQDYFYSAAFEQSIAEGIVTTENAISPDKNIEKLLQGRVDMILEDLVVVKEYERINKIDQTLKIFDQAITSDYNHIVFTKSKDLSELRKGIDLELRKMKADGSLYDIFHEYNMDYYSEAFKLLITSNPPAKKYFQDDDSMPLSVGILGDTKPYAYYENDQLIGFGVEFIEDVLTRIGVTYELVDIPFSRMLEELKNGTLDIGTDLYLKPDRQEYVEYPTLPYAGYPTVIFKKSSHDLNFTGDLEELSSYTVGYVRDYYLGPLEDYKDQYALIATGSPEQNIENLVNNRVDLIIDIKSTGENIIDEMDLKGEIVPVEPAIFFDYSYIVFSKANNLGNLIYEYEATVESMFEDGTIKGLSEKYGLPYLEFEELK